MTMYATPRRFEMLASSPRHQIGFSLVELMISMVLGLLLVGAMLGLYLTNSQTLRVNTNYAKLQENSRFAVDMLAREIRDAAMNPCGSTLTANVIRDPFSGAAPWWANTYLGFVQGWDGNQATTAIQAFGSKVNQRYSDTDSASGGDNDASTDSDAILVLRPVSDEGLYRVIESHDPINEVFKIVAMKAGDKDRFESTPALICDYNSAALVQLGAVSESLSEIDYATAALNCTSDLGQASTDCASHVAKAFAPGAWLVRLDSALWYLGNNDLKGRSLYRVSVAVNSTTGELQNQVEEMVRDVTSLHLEYLTRDRNNSNALATEWVSASDLTGKWTDPSVEVVGIRVSLQIKSPESVGSDGKPLKREATAVVHLRNREL